MSGVFRLIAIVVFSLSAIPAQSNSTEDVGNASFESMIDQIKAGIENVVHVVSARYNPQVESYLRSYIERNPARTSLMLGRSSLYFPMFEEELAKGGLPTDLKYLAVVESALSCQAVSPVGAAGLWQFMRPTARECGLTVTKYVDERCDPLKATRAAIKYLTFLYNQFESWELAMAAYNSGPGRVRYAIRKSGSKDYWKIQRYLPRETRAYVPGFIAASYILNYYQDHGITPEYPSSDFTHTESIEIFKGLSFSEISSVTGVPMEVIQELNPTYIRKFIPQSHSGYTLRLPVYATVAMQAYVAEDAAEVSLVNFEGIETGVEMEYVDRLIEETYIIRSGDNLYNIARMNGCSVDDLKTWNRLSGNTIHIGQRLKIKKMAKVLIRVPKTIPTARPMIEVPVLPVLSSVTNAGDLIRKIPAPVGVTPVIRAPLDISTSPAVMRRRTSLRAMGIPAGQVHSTLAPGTCLE